MGALNTRLTELAKEAASKTDLPADLKTLAGKCEMCGKCRRSCPDNLPVPEAMKALAQGDAAPMAYLELVDFEPKARVTVPTGERVAESAS